MSYVSLRYETKTIDSRKCETLSMQVLKPTIIRVHKLLNKDVKGLKRTSGWLTQLPQKFSPGRVQSSVPFLPVCVCLSTLSHLETIR